MSVVYAVRRTPPPRRVFPWRRWVVGCVVVASGAVGSWWLVNSGTFAVSRLGTGPYRFTNERDLKSALAPLLGRNLWMLDKGTVTEALADLPWVRQVYVQRRLPGDVDIEIIEWRPLLTVVETGAVPGAHTLVLVEDGHVLEVPEHLVPPVLPVLTGVLVERTADGPWRLPGDIAPNVLELVAAIEATGLEGAIPVDFVVFRPDGFGIVLQDNEGTLLVGREDFAARLTRFMTGRQHLERGLEIDLRFHERITVRPRATVEDDEPEEPPAAKEQA